MIHDRFAAPLVVGRPGIAGGGAPTIAGGPTIEEAVAVMAAIEHLWPKPVLVLPTTTTRTTPPWRFSGRWWVRPVAARRDRPYT
jgi:hypothetical protein